MVAPEAGTTRDAVDSLLRFRGKTLNFIDTAGLRRRAKVEDDLEFYSTLRTQRAIERAQVCVLVVDAAIGLHNQDLRIATEAWDARLRAHHRGQQVGPDRGEGREHGPAGRGGR